MPAAPAGAKSYTLPAADVVVRVQRDGSLLVEETIAFAFSGSFSGAFRELPLRPGETLDRVGVSEGGNAYTGGACAEVGCSG